MIVPHAVHVLRLNPQQLGHIGHHGALVGPLGGDLQQIGVGEDHLVVLPPVGEEILLGLDQHGVVLLHNHLGPGGGHLVHPALLVRHSHPVEVFQRDHVGVVDVDLLPVVGLKGQVRVLGAQLAHVLPGLVGQLALFHIPPRLEVIDSRPVGHHHRGVELQVFLFNLGGKGALGPASGDGKPSALLHKVPDGPVILLRHREVLII